MLHYDQVTSLPNKVKPGKPSQIAFHQKCKIRTFCGHLLTFESLITMLCILQVIALSLKRFCWVEKQEKK